MLASAQVVAVRSQRLLLMLRGKERSCWMTYQAQHCIARPVCQSVSRLQVLLLPVSALRRFASSAPAAVVCPSSARRPSQCAGIYHRSSNRRRRSRNRSLSRVHPSPCTNLTCCPMILYPYISPTSYSTEELSAGRPTCSTCNVVHCNTKSTVDQQQRASSRIHGSCILHRSAHP